MAGRPTTYQAEIVAQILLLLSEGNSLRRICAENEAFPAESTFRGWVVDDENGISAQYSRARDMGLDAMADETLDIADDGSNDYTEKLIKGKMEIVLDREHISRSTLRVNQRNWYLSKLAPKRYGTDKLEVKQTLLSYEQWLEELSDPPDVNNVPAS